MKETIINHFLDYEFVYIFLFCCLFPLICAIFIKLKIIRKITFVLFSVFFILFVFEFALSFFYDKAIADYHKDYMYNKKDILKIRKNEHIKILFDGKKHDFYNRNIDAFSNYSVIFNSEYSVYENILFRYTKCNIDSDQTYVFLGCSFIFGLGLNDNETLPYYFSRIFNFEKNVINCGVSGQGSNTALNILNNNTFEFLMPEKSKVEHFFYALMKDHIYRNFRYLYCMDGYLYKNNKFYVPTTIGKIKYFFARSYIFRKVFASFIDKYFDQYYEDYMINSLEQMNKIAEEIYNSKFTIIVWFDGYSERFIKKLKESNLDLIFLPVYFNSEEDGYKIKYDGHPTAKANEEIAKILYNHIKEQ